MGDNLDKAFVALNYIPERGMPILEWALDHFDDDKIILTYYYGYNPTWKKLLLVTVEEIYLPRCRQKNFKAGILLPNKASDVQSSITELINVHGMRNLVCCIDDWIDWNLSRLFDENRGLSCKIWAIDERNGKLVFVRDTGLYPGNTATNKQMDELLRRENELMSELRYLKQSTIHQQLKEERNNLKDALDKLQNKEHATQKLSMGRDCTDFTLQELEHATQNFSASLELGKGAFGCVYKGYLRETDVAIKKLNSESTESISGFNTEVAILSTIRHPNIVTLLGACHDASALVFEFLPNGSLESHLEYANKATSLTWQIRTCIMAEISLALIFLHSNAENMIIHGDLKPDNILLDAKFVSKLGDFGISRFLKKPDSDNTACYETYHPAGTPGYMDPEFINSGMLTEKSDVYSFGVVILRLLTRKPAMCIALHVENAIENGKFHEILDASAGEWPLDQAKELAKLAIRCAQVARKARPNLFEVWPIIERLRRNL